MLNDSQQQAVDCIADKILVLAGAGTGKALQNGTGVLTAHGYKPIEQLSVGELVFASNGKLYPVTGVYPQGKQHAYEVQFNNRISIICNDNHLWFYQTAKQRGKHRGFTVGTLREIMNIPLKFKSGKFYKNNVYIPINSPLEFPVAESLPIDPWLLGYLLANGGLSRKSSVNICIPHSDILDKIHSVVNRYECKLTHYRGKNDIDYSIVGIKHNKNVVLAQLHKLNLTGCYSYSKFIPDMYKYASCKDRLNLLQGLFDGDGCNFNNCNEYTTSSKQLADDIIFICESLGMTVTCSKKLPTYVYKDKKLTGRTVYRLFIKSSEQFAEIYQSKHHLDRKAKSQSHARHYIKEIIDLGYEADMTCISVASPDESFLTEHCIVTHNTHTMISRISRLVNDGIDTSSILVLTFTNAAACEMKERYKRLHKDQPTPTFCTFHSYCYSLIAKNPAVAQSLGYYEKVPDIADDAVIRKIHTSCKQQCGTKLSEDKLKGKVPLKPNEQFQYDIYWKQYNKLLRSMNYITFDIMCYEVSKLFAVDNPIVESEKSKYKYIFVDEFQDTDPKQWDFVSSFYKSNLFVVGDAKQAIYQFRGADSSIIKSLADNRDWTTLKLSQNYRSTKQICEYSNKIHSNWHGLAYNLDIMSDKLGTQVIKRGSLNLNSNAELLNIIEDSVEGKSVAILCRSNYEVADIKSKLDELKIPYNSKKSNSELGGILKCAIDSDFFIDWLSNKLTSLTYNNYLKCCSIDDKYKTEQGFIELHQGILSRYINIIMQIRKILCDEQFSYSKITSISELLKIPQGVIKLESDDNSGVINYLISVADSLSKETGVYVGTVHSVKGLEYDCVHLIGVNDKSFPVYRDEEQQNVYYVGCTRAKEKLVIYDADFMGGIDND